MRTEDSYASTQSTLVSRDDGVKGNMKKIVMIGTSLQTMGGIASVIKVYVAAGLFELYHMEYLATHCDGGARRKLGIMLRAYARFLVLLFSGRLGLLHVHVASRASFWRKSFFFLLAFLCRVPTILHLHGAEFGQFYADECGPVQRALIRFVFNRASRVVVLSEAWKHWVETISSNSRIDVIYNPVILPPSVAAWHARQRGNILSLGRIGKRKGSFDLLDAAARVADKVSDLRLLYGGDGDADAARLHADTVGMQARLSLLGWVGPQERERYLNSAYIYALPSYNEGLPMSVLEAMAAGMPILSTPVGGIPEAVTDGVEGFLVPPGDVAALADRLQQLLQDDVLAARMGTAARRKVEQCFSSQAVLPRLQTMYQELGFAPV